MVADKEEGEGLEEVLHYWVLRRSIHNNNNKSHNKQQNISFTFFNSTTLSQARKIYALIMFSVIEDIS